MAERLPGYDPADSDLETRVLRALVTAGQPVPPQQLTLGKRKFHLDLAYPDARVGIELDGWAALRRVHRLHHDIERDALLASAGWLVTHFSARTPDSRS